MKIGARYLGNSTCEFVVWAPLAGSVALKTVAPHERIIQMTCGEWGHWRVTAEGIAPETQYFFRIDGGYDRPDPASNLQPQGVHGPSAVVDHQAFLWNDAGWKSIAPADMVIYELHAGTFTPEGTFEAIVSRLDELGDLGINAIEMMPVAQFPGERNWGYDGVYPFAPQNSYGGPVGLKKLVDACHQRGIAVILDVVYNHFGPEGNYAGQFAPYFTDKCRTPWGDAINFDAPYSDGVRNYFIENALYWLHDFHIDALRLDGIHAICDMSATPFLRELAERVEKHSSVIGRKFYLIAESNLNDPKVIRPREIGGHGMDAQWCDDFHHSLRTLLTGETAGYYVDFGRPEDLVKALAESFVYDWRYSVFRKRHHGSSAKDRRADQFVVFSQNHDQIGNRMLGERLSQLVSFEAAKLAAGAVLLSPYIPLLFMGEEYGETAPFPYFVSHSDPRLIDAVRAGRKEEFRPFQWQGEPLDPQSPETFLRAKLSWDQRKEGSHCVLRDFYRRLIHLRREIPALAHLDRESCEVSRPSGQSLIFVRRWRYASQTVCIMNFAEVEVRFRASVLEGSWRKMIDSAEREWSGPGSALPGTMTPDQEAVIKPLSLVLFELET